MNMRKTTIMAFALLLIISSCATRYQLTGISRSRILIDSTYDNPIDSAGADFIATYKAKTDSIMSPVVGQVASYMWAEKPESNLSNLLADILIWAGKQYKETPEVSVYNMRGIRAALSEGDVTFGNVLDVAPFENKICFLDLNGKQLMELFEQIAANRGEGVNHGVNLVITRDGKLLSATLNGEPIDSERIYRIATIDYLAEGNDRLEVFKQKANLNSPKEERNNMRFIIANYFLEKQAKGEIVNAKIEGRIILK